MPSLNPWARGAFSLRPHPEEAAKRPSRRIGRPHAPISGLPEIGLLSTQVGYSRLAVTRSFGALRSMRAERGSDVGRVRWAAR